jgi:hypothetical protein
VLLAISCFVSVHIAVAIMIFAKPKVTHAGYGIEHESPTRKTGWGLQQWVPTDRPGNRTTVFDKIS